ncbi:P-loop containing nucleoside triphosphate hydrolase protein [Dendrothele bispora CBS 962.96]|uniref:P-loop containing nucleoside triphosphate hydrolase protein n=1 Tax=Dendrothele bispora (strain CBS 962.96) TaxID=1314807 RepID=A0A4S8M947_DENBC|nr:P-loop containing nucleoside triphosphate hydrolase protein [Dendrothele bispora CBS 962.96]
MDALKSLVQPLVAGAGGSSVIDGMKLVVIGGTVETARRMSSSAWSHFINSFFLTAHFSEEDYPYDWLMLWLSRRPEWQRSREFETTTRSTTSGLSSRIADNSFGDEDDEDFSSGNGGGGGAGGGGSSAGNGGFNDEGENSGRAKTRVVFQPTFDTTHTIYYRGHWLRVRRSRKNDGSGCEVLTISVVARSNTILKQLVLQAKREYEAEAIHRIQIYFADQYGSWRWTDSRHKRPMSSIVLERGVKEMLLGDTRDFLRSEKWYADRGIPFRRGYLLHGVPGSGKSSLIHAIAGELQLDIYVVSLSSSWISDATLNTLMGRVPKRCIVLLEDLDAAFTRSVARREEEKEKEGKEGKEGKEKEKKEGGSGGGGSGGRRRRGLHSSSGGGGSGGMGADSISEINTLSLSGLLNALDGVAAAEGRILFATTNHLDHLDPALSRPGRMDVWIEFKNASKWQAEALFRNFFPCADNDSRSKKGKGTDASATAVAAAGSTTSSSSSSKPASSSSQASLKQPGHSAKPLSASTLNLLAKKFSDGIPEGEFSVAALQGYLLRNKTRPWEAAEGVGEWVEKEREERGQRENKKKEKEREKAKKEQSKKEAVKESEKKKSLDGSMVEVTTASATVAAAAVVTQTTTSEPSSSAAAAAVTEPLPVVPEQSTTEAQSSTTTTTTTTSTSSSSSSSSDSDSDSDDGDDDDEAENVPPPPIPRGIPKPARSAWDSNGWSTWSCPPMH